MTEQPAPDHIGTGVHMTGTTFLRSTTTTVVDREADGDTDIDVQHLARFALTPGALPDQLSRYSRTRRFRPSWAEALWREGALEKVWVTGPRVLKDGSLSSHDTGRDEWERGYRRDENKVRVAFDRDALPAKLADAIAAYETRVATLTGGPR